MKTVAKVSGRLGIVKSSWTIENSELGTNATVFRMKKNYTLKSIDYSLYKVPKNLSKHF